MSAFPCWGRTSTMFLARFGRHNKQPCLVFAAAVSRTAACSSLPADPDWACSIAEGPAGITAARWTPDGQHILLTADFNVRLSVWSLVDQSCVYLRGPKHAHAGLAFSPDGRLLALAHVSSGGVGAAAMGACWSGAQTPETCTA